MIMMNFVIRRTEVMSIGEFLRKEGKVEKKGKVYNNKLKTSAIVGGVSILLTNKITMAAENEAVPVLSQADVTAKIITAFEPIVELAQALSYPIAFVAITIACLLYMINQKEKAISMIQNASLGYIFVQIAPLFMKLLAEIGKSI
jgi:hypothetical protein